MKTLKKLSVKKVAAAIEADRAGAAGAARVPGRGKGGAGRACAHAEQVAARRRGHPAAAWIHVELRAL